MRWAYGLTTVPIRRRDLLPRTLASLALAGWDKPRLFVDGDTPESWEREYPNLAITARKPAIRTYGNWILGLAELFLRDPCCDRYAMFQDDFVCYRNLRLFLEKSRYPDRGYLNLFTFRSNEIKAPAGGGWYEAAMLNPDTDKSEFRWQTGRGAVALVFNRPAVMTLLNQSHMIERATDPHTGWRKVDGGVVTAMNKAGWREYVHSPSLVQHTGAVSSMKNQPHHPSRTFLGEEYDAIDLLR